VFVIRLEKGSFLRDGFAILFGCALREQIQAAGVASVALVAGAGKATVLARRRKPVAADLFASQHSHIKTTT